MSAKTFTPQIRTVRSSSSVPPGIRWNTPKPAFQTDRSTYGSVLLDTYIIIPETPYQHGYSGYLSKIPFGLFAQGAQVVGFIPDDRSDPKSRGWHAMVTIPDESDWSGLYEEGVSIVYARYILTWPNYR